MEKPCILIPSYNEAMTIGPIVKWLKAQGFDIYVVDDGSTDDTAAMASGEGAFVIRNDKNMGKGKALREGFGRILKEGYGAVLVMDGDDQHDLADIEHLIRKMEESNADMVIGNRMLDTSSMPNTRILVNRFMSSIISRIAGQRVPDTQCGFRLIKREVLEGLELESSRYEIESELILKAARKGFRVEWAPVKTVYRNEKSRIDPVLDTIRFIALLIRLGFKR